MQQIRYYECDLGLMISLKDLSKKLFELKCLTERQSKGFDWETRLHITKKLVKGLRIGEITNADVPVIIEMSDFFINWTLCYRAYKYVKLNKRSEEFENLMWMCDNPDEIRNDISGIFTEVRIPIKNC